ncbi:hypothetical protein BGZ94_001865 [Podila epigama]|nr:hypothetical protein BGZ94_001865 [Podila epigama]
MPPKKKAASKKSKAKAAAIEETVEVPATPDTVDTKETDVTPIKPEAEQSAQEEPVQRTRRKTTTTTTTVTETTITTVSTSESVEPEAKALPVSKSTKSDKKKDHDMEVKKEDDQSQSDILINDSNESSTSSKGSTLAERMAKLKGLRQQLNASKQANRADVMSEHQRSKINLKQEMKKERAREEAEQLIAKRDMEEAGEDYERAQFWGYSAESVERWNEKQEAKKVRMDQRFTDWDQVNHKKYLKQVGGLKPNLHSYDAKKQASMHVNEDGEMVVDTESGFYRDANSVAFLSDAKPDSLAIDRMAADVAKQIDARTRFSKRRAHKEDEDVNYINDANQRFNQKISRFYDKHTKEIRDDFERGTAL